MQAEISRFYRLSSFVASYIIIDYLCATGRGSWRSAESPLRPAIFHLSHPTVSPFSQACLPRENPSGCLDDSIFQLSASIIDFHFRAHPHITIFSLSLHRDIQKARLAHLIFRRHFVPSSRKFTLVQNLISCLSWYVSTGCEAVRSDGRWSSSFFDVLAAVDFHTDKRVM